MDNKWLMSLVLLLIGFVLGYLSSFSAWGAAPRAWMMHPYGQATGDYYYDFNPNLRVNDEGRGPGWGMGWMMGYPAPGFVAPDGSYPTTTPEGYPINY